MDASAPKRNASSRFASILATACLAAGCHGDAGTGQTASPTPPGTSGPVKVRVGYLGLTCEAAMFVAQENGFFTDEGLDVEFVKTDWDGLRDGLGLGRFDANYHLIMYLLKPIEKGLDVKITGGVHSGCLRLQAGAKTDIKSVADLQGQEDRRADGPGQPAVPLQQPGAQAAPAWTRRRTSSGWRWRPTSWAWRSTRGRSTPSATPSRSARSCSRRRRSGRSPTRRSTPRTRTSIAAPWSSAGPSRGRTRRRPRR